MSDNLYLFANNNGGQAEGNGSYRLYDMKIEGEDIKEEGKVNYADYILYDKGGNAFITPILYQAGLTAKFKLKEGLSKLNASGAGMFTMICQLCTSNKQPSGGNNDYKANGNFIMGKFAVENGKAAEIPCENGVYSYTFTENLLDKVYYIAFGGGSKDWGGNPLAVEYFKIYNSGNQLLLDLRPCFDKKDISCMYDEISKKYIYSDSALSPSFKIRKKLRDFQPVLDSNNVPCLLDKINNKFYYNKSGEVFKTKEKIVKKLPFIKTDGASYINTKLKPTDITGGTVEIKCDTLSFGTTKFVKLAVFGCGTGVSTGDTTDFGLKNNYNRQLTGFESTEITNDGDLVIHKGIGVNATREKEIYVGAINGRNGAYYGDSSIDGFRISYFKIWNSEGVLIQHLISAIDENNNVGMYDEVTKTFFSNQGTGTFGYEIEELEAQDKNYREVKYIESNGTQYIDTGVVANSNTDIDMTSRLSAIPYYYAGYKCQVNTPAQQVSMVFELDFKYANDRGGKGNILGGNTFYILADGTYSLDATTSTGVSASTTKYDKIKVILNLESKKQIVYVNNMKIGECECTSPSNRLSVGGSAFDFCSFYTHYVNSYRLSDMTPLHLLRPHLGKYTYDSFEYTIPKLIDTLTGTEYQTSFGDALHTKYIDYGYDNNFIYNKLKLINLSAVQNPSAPEKVKLQYDKTVYEFNGVNTAVKPNLVASSGATLTMGSVNLVKLNDDDIEIATNNGWSLT